MGFELGCVSFEYGLCLGPMAGYSDRAMRVICHREGAEYAVSEMVSAKAICYRDKKPRRLRGSARTKGRRPCRSSAVIPPSWRRPRE